MVNARKYSLISVAAGIILVGSAVVGAQVARPTAHVSGAGASAAVGYWQGTNTASQLPGRVFPTTMVLNPGRNVTGGFVTGSGVYGSGTGTFNGNTGTMTWTNATPQCPGTYTNTYQVSGDTISWTYSGQDCLGPETGTGQATRVRFPASRRSRR
jgi:hypothetical protein